MNLVRFFAVVILILTGLLTFSTNKKSYIRNDYLQVDSLIHQWREDSLGCKKNRNYKNAQLIVNKHNLKEKTVFEIINLIGEPNKRLKNKVKGVILGYYYNTCCKNGKIDLDECDYSWFDFIFNDSADKKCTTGGGVI